MSDVDKFVEAVKNDKQAQDRIAAAGDWEESIKISVQVASEKGYNLTEDDVRSHLHGSPTGELTEAELEKVAGGGWTSNCHGAATWDCNSSC
ncbi:Nif11-like leader peptide family RiPP precursor [Ruegeria lacuscaerulensis]|uniref:Nif11-like leader peptide family RiPP precursor n=1 Tax=Ruegeria lacuscaerulensis TaxID=55218 RepID=UPI00147B699B|nr:Nif11-like leader peptide family RiPP precursor [Ruegeria lacuscaerulensis]